MFTEPKSQVKFQAALKIVFREGDSYTHYKHGGLKDIEYRMSMVLDTEEWVFWSIVITESGSKSRREIV